MCVRVCVCVVVVEIFQNAMFDYQRVTIKNWDAICSQKAIWLWIKTFRIDW